MIDNPARFTQLEGEKAVPLRRRVKHGYQDQEYRTDENSRCP